METKIYKDNGGAWGAKTFIPLTLPERAGYLGGVEKAFLQVTTCRAYNGVVRTLAWVVWDNQQTGMTTQDVGLDFSRAVMRHDVKRLTEKAITLCHNEALRIVENSLNDVIAHYNKDH